VVWILEEEDMSEVVEQKVDGGEKKAEKGSTRKPLFISLRWKLLVSFTLVFTVVFALAFYWFYTFATTQAMDRIKQDLLDTLNGASKAISAEVLVTVARDGARNASGEAWLAVANAEEEETEDAASLRADAEAKFNIPGDFSDDERYKQLMDELQAIHNIEPRAWPYVFVAGADKGTITYIADLWARYNPSKATPFQFTKSSKQSLLGLDALRLRLDAKGKFNPYADEWGQWVSAYQPILDADGNKVGAIGIDFEAGYVNQVQIGIRDRVWIAFGITYIGIFAVVFLLARTLTRPIQKLTVSAERLGEGDYSQDITKARPKAVTRDEIVTLADVFTIMANKVYQREQTLRKQVEALKIEIDESKKAKQVSEIADSDFFKDLQAKARNLREKNK
jgi:HAMP domain-containing protein